MRFLLSFFLYLLMKTHANDGLQNYIGEKMKITKAQRIQSHLIQAMGKAGMFGSNTLGNRERFKNFLSDLTSTPPKGCKLKVGDKVIYTNAKGIEFELVVSGFDSRPRHPDATIFIADGAYWYAEEENNLRSA